MQPRLMMKRMVADLMPRVRDRPEDRAVASLMYDNIPFDHGYAVADGDPSVTFSDCATPATQWTGAFVVAGARCVRLLVNDAAGRRVAARRIAFGVRDCASR